jgi:DNA-binding NtrC family response regulator
MILSGQGYEVILASDGETGLEEFYRQQERIALVICDQMMPGMSGTAVLAHIHREAPEVRLIAMSGLTENLPVPGSVGLGALLHKPVKANTLLQTVRRMLDAPAAVPASGR